MCFYNKVVNEKSQLENLSFYHYIHVSMKQKTIPVIFTIIALALAAVFFLSKSFFLGDKTKDNVRAKIVTLVSSTETDSESDSFIHSAEVEKYETFVPLRSNETLISSITIDFNNDTFDDEIIVVRRSGSSYLCIIPGIYNSTTGKYDRLPEIETTISRTRTFSYTGMDITGDHRTALVFQGDAEDGTYVMKIFLMKGDDEVITIGDFVSDGTVFVQQTERSESYELSLSKGESYSVWVYKSEPSTESGDGKKQSSSLLNQIQQEYKWNGMTERYELAREIKVSAGRLAAKELSRIQDGTVETFASFLNGLWYKTSNNDSQIRYLYFDYPKKELILLNDDIQEVYEWGDSKIRHNGIYLTTVNSDIMNLHRRFDITLTNVDEIKITVRDDVNLVIKESNLWDGVYKKMASQSYFQEKTQKDELDIYENELKKGPVWKSADLQDVISFTENRYTLSFNEITEEGIYSLIKIGSYNVIQFLSDTETSMLAKTYVMNFGVKTITETVKKKTVEKQVTDYDTITFTPVKITPTDCFSADGQSYTFERSE